ncbi:hypothetical protein [Shewanella mesophila]|nr:hypothetical protein [Shewanella mesophila]
MWTTQSQLETSLYSLRKSALALSIGSHQGKSAEEERHRVIHIFD